MFPGAVFWGKEFPDSSPEGDSWILQVDWGSAQQVVGKEYAKQREQDKLLNISF